MRGRVEPVPAISLLGGACMSYTFSLSRRSLPVRCLCLLLIVLVLWCFFMVPRAGAVAVEAATVAYGGLLVGTILVGAGVVFSSHGDMAKVGAAMYKTMSNGSSAIASKIAAISSWAVEHGEKIGSAALRVGKDLYQGIVDAFNTAYSNGNFVIGEGYSELSQFVAACPSSPSVYIKSLKSGSWERYSVETSESLTDIFLYEYDLIGGQWHRYSHSSMLYCSSPFASSNWFVADDGFYCRIVHANGSTDDFRVFELPRSIAYVSDSFPEQIAIPQPDLKYPSDDYLVRMPDIPSVDTSTGDVTYPNDTAYTKDAVSVPYPIDTEGVKVPDIPYDKVVDQSSGKALDDTGTDTDTPSKPGEGTDTGSNTSLLQKILDLLKNFFDSPSDFRLNMDGFRNLAIKDKFPFCIPFDMVDSVKQFAADAADYQFRVKLDTQYFKVDHVVDLTPLAVPLAFFRYLVVAWFAWVLMSRTHDLMKW